MTDNKYDGAALSIQTAERLATLESTGKALHTLSCWFEQKGMLQLGWDEGEAIAHNLLVEEQEAKVLVAHIGQQPHHLERMEKPQLLRAAEDFFSAASHYVELQLEILRHPGSWTEGQKTIDHTHMRLDTAYAELHRRMKSAHPELHEPLELLRQNVNAAMKLVRADRPMTLQEAGADTQGYVYNAPPAALPEQTRRGHRGEEPISFARRIREAFLPNIDTLGVKLAVKWPPLPEWISHQRVESIAAARNALIETRVAQHNGQRADHLETMESIGEFMRDALRREGFAPDSTSTLIARHLEVVDATIRKEAARVASETHTGR